MTKNRFRSWAFSLALIGGAYGSLFTIGTAEASYEDSRAIPPKSKAKSSITAIRKELAKLDKILDENDERKLTSPSSLERSYDKIERYLTQIAEREPSWDLRKEKTYFADLKKRLKAAGIAAEKRKMEEAEPDPDENPVKPFAGAPKMKAEAPDWCDAAPFKDSDSWMTGKSSFDNIITKPDSRQLRRAAQHACRAPSFAKRQKWSRNWRQAIANQTGANSKAISRFFAAVLKNADQDGKLEKQHCDKFGGELKARAGQPAPTADMKAFREAEIAVLGCARSFPAFGGDVYGGDLDYWMDRGIAPPSEIVRVGFILSQLGFGYTEVDLRRDRDLGEKVLNRLRNYALVATDLTRLDEGKFKKEIAAMGLNDWGKAVAELSFHRAKHLGRVYETYFKGMSPAIQELAMKAPKAGFAAWEKAYASNAAAIDRYFEVEKKLLSKQQNSIKGCYDKAHSAFAAYVTSAAKNQSDKEEKLHVVKDAIGSTLLKASMICASFEGEYGVAATLYNRGLNQVRAWRGPRLAGYWAMVDRFAELKSQDPSLPLEGNNISLFLFGSGKSAEALAYENTYNNTGLTQSESGQVKKVKKVKGGVELTFKTVKWKETIWDCKETNRIDRISSEGKIIYRQKCKAKGQKTVSSTVKPYRVPGAMASGLKAGQFVVAKVENGKAGRVGVPIEVYTSADQKKLIGSLGATF